MSLVLLLVILIISNLAFAYSSGWSRLGWQLFGFGGLFIVFRLASLSLADIGLSRNRLGAGFKYGMLAIAIILLVLLALFFIKQNVFHDKRYDQSLRSAIAAALFYLPLKTVLFEELAFRGIMPALLKDIGSKPWLMLIISSLLFALWHITTAPKTGSLSVSNFSNLFIIGGILIFTFVGGIILYLLRYHSGSLVASIMVHWFINGAAIVLAALSWLAK